VADFKVQCQDVQAKTCKKMCNGAASIAMPLIPNIAIFQRKIGGFPIATYQAGETVIAAASTTGRLLILRTGAVAVLREGVEIATVREPGAVFGELSVLLDQPHSADVRALEVSQFYVADAATLLRVDPIALLYVATVLARRLDDANQALIELRRELEAGRPRSVIEKTARGSKDCWARGRPTLRMPAIPTTCSPPRRRADEAWRAALGAASPLAIIPSRANVRQVSAK
jgi:cAMP-binding proteins - catabolite gene activator and regulatory subunit of cAMP-dependent protein kinases